jgi:DNA-damage-inducible protein J
MMAQVNIRIDDTLKDQADSLFEELGMNMSTAINVFIREALRRGAIPFKVSTEKDPFYNPANIARLQESIQQAKEGRIVVKTIEELERMADE